MTSADETMSTDKIRVTVDEPVTREITLEQVRAYLRAKGWEKTRDKTDRDGIVWAEAWKREGGSVLIYLEHSAILVASSIRDICRVEGRSPAAVLREIAGETDPVPLDMILPCPRCGMLHVDAPEPDKGWTNPAHKSHQCHFCTDAEGRPTVWRPASVPTNGVGAIDSIGKADTWKPCDLEGRAQYGEPWIWTGKAGPADVRVTVGPHALFVERVDGADVAPEVHRAALAEALGAAVLGKRTAEERPTRAELFAAVEEARAALIVPAEAARYEETIAISYARGMLERVSAGQPREKSPAEARADEIEAEAMKHPGFTLDFEAALFNARKAREEMSRVVLLESREAWRLDAAAWLLVAQRLLAREATR